MTIHNNETSNFRPSKEIERSRSLEKLIMNKHPYGGKLTNPPQNNQNKAFQTTLRLIGTSKVV